MALRRARVLLIALALLGCTTVLQTAGQIPEEDSHPHVLVYYGDTGGAIGLRYGFTTKPQEVRIRAGMPANQQRRVVAHELFHATGWGRHFDYEGCYMASTQGNYPTTPPCPQEVEAIRRVRRTVTVIQCDPALEADVRWSADLWNRAAGRTVIAVDLRR